MWEIISNPVTLSVIVMCVLCLCKLNVILSLLVSAMVAGFAAGMGPGEIMGGIITGLNGNGTNAIAYLLLGTFAAALAQTGLATMLAKWIASVVKERKWILLATLVVCAMISGTIIPVHIAYIPVLFPPLLVMMNKMKMDRRQAACVTEFGLVAPYVTIPLGYGVIFQPSQKNSQSISIAENGEEGKKLDGGDRGRPGKVFACQFAPPGEKRRAPSFCLGAPLCCAREPPLRRQRFCCNPSKYLLS